MVDQKKITILINQNNILIYLQGKPCWLQKPISDSTFFLFLLLLMIIIFIQLFLTGLMCWTSGCSL